MKNVIQFPAKISVIKKNNVDYSDFLANSDNYKNVSHFPIKNYYSKNSSVIQTYLNYNAFIANQLSSSQKENYNKHEIERSNIAFLMLNILMIIGCIVAVLGLIFNASTLCSYVFSSMFKMSIVTVSLCGSLFSIYQGFKIIKVIRRSNEVINSKQGCLLFLSFLYTVAFTLTPLCLFASKVVCNK